MGTVIEIHAENWKDGGKSAAQWRASLRDYAVPKLGSKLVDRMTTADVMEVLLSIWSTKRETARRVRQRIGSVPHGFRSSFRDWAAERTDVPREVCELALAHVNSDRVEAAYRRSDLFERRRQLMQDWSGYLAAKA